MRKGFTLLELVVAVGIMLIIGAAAAPLLLKHLKDAKVANLNEQLLNMKTAFNSYYVANEGVLTDHDADNDYLDEVVLDGWLSSEPTDKNFTFVIEKTTDNPADYYIKMTPQTGAEATALEILTDLDERLDGGDGNAAGSLQWDDPLGNAYYKIMGDAVWH